MSWYIQVMIAICSVGVLIGLMATVHVLAGRFGMGAEVQRKLIHVGTGFYALTLPWLFPDRWPVYMLILLTLFVMIVLRSPQIAKSGVSSALHGVDRKSYGDFMLAISVGLCFFLSNGIAYLYVIPIAILTFSDAAAALIGSNYGRQFFQVEEGKKSIEGTAVFFALTLIVTMICLLTMTTFAPINIVLLSLMVAAFGSFVEAVSWRGFDNLFLPLAILVFLAVYAEKEIPDLLLLVGFFVAIVVAFRMNANKFGLTTHATRVYVTTAFLLGAATTIQNAILPILVLISYIICRKKNPCSEKYGELDIVAAIVLVSLGWLTMGLATGANAVSFYGITAMGMVMALSVLAVHSLGKLWQAVFMLVVVFILIAVRYMVIILNSIQTHWAGDLWPIATSTILFSGTISLICASWFARTRVIKITVLSLILPFTNYIYLLFKFEVIT